MKVPKVIVPKHAMFNYDTVNIFTDASIIKYPNETIGCAGAHIVTGYDATSEILEQPRIIIRNSTNNNSEINAILLGVRCALRYKNFKQINLISDSKICIFGLREWIFNWIRDSQGSDVLISSQGTEVANQQVILQIIYTILNNDLRINLFHQNGHVNINNQKQMENAKNTFINSNHIEDDIDMELIKEISIGNDIVDKFTRKELENFSPETPIPNTQELVRFFYDPFDVDKYKHLLKIK